MIKAAAPCLVAAKLRNAQRTAGADVLEIHVTLALARTLHVRLYHSGNDVTALFKRVCTTREDVATLPSIVFNNAQRQIIFLDHM